MIKWVFAGWLILSVGLVTIDYLQVWLMASHHNWIGCLNVSRSIVFGSPFPTIEPWFNLAVGVSAAVATVIGGVVWGRWWIK